MPLDPQFQISLSLITNRILSLLKSLAGKEITSTRFFQLMALEVDDSQSNKWLDVVDILIDGGLLAFQNIEAAVREHRLAQGTVDVLLPPLDQGCTSASVDSTIVLPPQGSPPSLRQNLSAWRMVWDWAAGVFEFPALISTMEKTFGDQFVHEQWRTTFDAVFDASSTSDNESAMLQVPQTPPAIQVVEDIMRSLGVSIASSRSFAPLQSNPAVRARSPEAETRRPSKRRRTGSKRRQTRSIFLDIDTSEGGDDDEDEDESETIQRIPVESILPAGRATYAQQLEQVIKRYEQVLPPSQGQLAADVSAGISPVIDPGHSTQRIYIVDFGTVNIMTFCRTILEERGLRCQRVPLIPHKVYVEALSPRHIYSCCPPSHKTTIRSIVLLSDNDRVFLQSLDTSIRPGSWVRVLRGLYRDDIGYVHAADADSCDVLVVPRRCLYDDVIENAEPHLRQRKLFDELAAAQKGLTVVPVDGSPGVVTCRGEFYHRGLLRRSFRPSSLDSVDTPHPDRITLHAAAQIDLSLIEQTYHMFSTRYWKEGDLVRPLNGPLLGQRTAVFSVDLSRSTVDVSPCDPDIPGCTLLLADVRRIFRTGDDIKVIAGIHRGSTGYVLSPGEHDITVLVGLNNIIVVPATFLESHLPHHVASAISSRPHLDIAQAPPATFDEHMQGDMVDIISGQHRGCRGVLESFEADGWMWVFINKFELASQERRDEAENGTVALLHEDEVKVSKPDAVLSYTKDRGYDVSVGDILQVVRGVHLGLIGLVENVNLATAEVRLVPEAQVCPVTVPIPLCCRFNQFSLPVPHVIGHTVWIIHGEKKGFRATLHAYNRARSVVSLPNYYNFEVMNQHLATECGLLLSGARLQGPLLEEFRMMIARSYRSETSATRATTPPPTPGTREDSVQDPAWSIAAEDRTSPVETVIDKGCVGWLFDDLFCDFSQYALCFNVSAAYCGGNYSKRVMQTGPNRFANPDGPAPIGSVSLSVSGNHAGAKVEHHHVPAHLLDPANPTSKNQYVLVLQGDLKGTFCKVLRWIRKEKKAEVTAAAPTAERREVTLNATDICLAVPFAS